MADATIVIVARNASRTIARAVRSAVGQGDWPVLLVDDQSTDATAAIAAGSGRVRVERLAAHRTLGHARQRALDLVETEFTVLLDADDELLPGRVARLVEAMRADGTQFVADGIELCDGASGCFVQQMPIPGFLQSRRVLARLFERNYLPGIGQIAFRTAFARGVGYDTTMHGAEDVDLVLRAVAAGAEFSLVETIGYRMYAYPDSLSRNIENQRRMTRYCLAKHDDDAIGRLYERAGYDRRTIAWGLVSVALFRDEWGVAVGRLRAIEDQAFPPSEILEPDGPYPFPEGWRLDFQLGTVALLQGHLEDAAERLTSAERRRQTPEGANNLGVACFGLGQVDAAGRCFATALERFPGYRDAHVNADAARPQHITIHPLRAAPNRDDYTRRDRALGAGPGEGLLT